MFDHILTADMDQQGFLQGWTPTSAKDTGVVGWSTANVADSTSVNGQWSSCTPDGTAVGGSYDSELVMQATSESDGAGGFLTKQESFGNEAGMHMVRDGGGTRVRARG